MSTRTTRVFRDDGLFEYLAAGPILLDRLEGAGPGRHMRTAFAFTMLALSIAVFLLARESGQVEVTYVAGAATAALALVSLFRLSKSLLGGAKAGKDKRGPMPVIISNDGVEQPLGGDESIRLSWDDIRLVRKQDHAQSVRGTDKKHAVSISERLARHVEATAIVKFLFVLRQEMGDAWQGAIPSLKQRLSDKGIPIYSRHSRKWYVVVSQKGLAVATEKQGRAELTWDEVDRSLYEVKRGKIVIRHVQSRTTLEIPADLESPILFDQLMRWALHSDPVFGI